MAVHIVTLPNGLFGSASKSWKKLDLNKIQSLLNFESKIFSFKDIDSLAINSNDILIYTSSANDQVRAYVKNKLFYIKEKCNIVPNYELLMAHEDKGFQEVLKKEKGIGNLKGHYIFDLDDQSMDFPKVLKTSQGAGSSGVFLVKEYADLSKIRSKFFGQDLKRKVIQLQRQLKLTKQEYEIYNYKYKKFNLFVEQEFIPDLEHDFKVLVFGDRYFILKRNVRENDFRASGSGKFEFIEPPLEVLSFAKDVAEALDNPYLSLDIAQSKSGCHLIEFQATNFGPYTLLNAPSRYIYKGQWIKEENCKDLEANYAHALNYYIGKKYA